MKRSVFFSALCVLALASCKQPAEVELTDDLAFEGVVDDQPTLERQSVDSTGLLPSDESTFAGQIFLSSVTTRTSRGVETAAFSRVIFEDRAQPILSADSVRRGFLGIRVGSVALNGAAMVERSRRVASISGGFDYLQDLRGSYAPRQRFTWQVIAPLTVGTFEASIESPDNMEVISPVGGSTISRNEDLELKWNGRGAIGLIVSVMRRDPQVATRLITKPIFNSVINKPNGKVKVSRKILRALPSADAYVFTFVRVNRDVKTINRFNGKVLVQAASIYNSVIALR